MARLTPQYEVIPQPARRMTRDAGKTIREQRVFCLKAEKILFSGETPLLAVNCGVGSA